MGAFSLSSWMTIGPMEVVSFTFIGAFPLAAQEEEGAAGCGAWASAATGRAQARTVVAMKLRREGCMARFRWLRKRELGDDGFVDDAPVAVFSRPVLALGGAPRHVVRAVVLLEG